MSEICDNLGRVTAVAGVIVCGSIAVAIAQRNYEAGTVTQICQSKNVFCDLIHNCPDFIADYLLFPTALTGAITCFVIAIFGIQPKDNVDMPLSKF